MNINWEKKLSRPLKLNKAEDYSKSLSGSFADMFGRGLQYLLDVSRENVIDFYHDVEEWDRFTEYAYKKYRDSEFCQFILDEFLDLYQPHIKFLEKLDETDLTEMTTEDLMAYYQQYKASLLHYYAPMWLNVITEHAMEKVVYDILQLHSTLKQIDTNSQIIFSITKDNFILEEERDLLTISKLPEAEQEQALQKHVKKYEYIPVYDFDLEPYPYQRFKERLEEIKTNSEVAGKIERTRKELQSNITKFNKLLKKLPLSQQDELSLRAIHLLFNHKDDRSRLRNSDCYIARKYFIEIAKRLSVEMSDLMYLLDEEIVAALRAAKITVDINARKKAFALLSINREITLYVGQDLEEFLEENIPKETASELKGSIVGSGKAQGPVKIVLHPEQFDKIQEGDVLVATMTRPEYVPIMKKSCAIVTDEGGMLCHAAIVARELNKPCVVGTKNATEILKDGDKVEVDAEEGIVRKL